MADGEISTPARLPVRLADYTAPRFSVREVALDFNLDPEGTIVRARLHLRRQSPGPLVLDGRELELLSVSLDGAPLAVSRYLQDAQSLTIAETPDDFTLETQVKIIPRANTELSGLYMSGSGFFTQCEPEGFRRITYFPDRPDVMARYSVTLRADKARFPVLLSNGNQVAQGQDGGIAWATWEDPHPKPSYLFALVAADLIAVRDTFTTASGREVALGIWVARGDETRCGHAMLALKKSMQWDEATFGLEYDLDIFNIAAVSDFNAGAMENKGLNIFNTAYVLASLETATDADFQGVERVIAHEYFHNWTGDRVTCRDWFQLSLKEGLTVFRDQEYMADQFSAATRRIADVRMLRATQFREDAGPLAHPVRPASYLEINNFYTTTIYEKGAEVVRMVRTLIGRDKFRQGIDLYIRQNDNSAATVEDFLKAMQAAEPALDLRQMMRWYDQAGTPVVTFEESYDPQGRIFTLMLRQNTPPTPGQPVKEPFLIPISLALLDEHGQELHAQTIIFNQTEQRFTFADIARPPVASLFRHFSAPIKLKGQSHERLAFLAAHETDMFNRWDALQQYAGLVLRDAVAAPRKFSLDAGLARAFAATLARAADDPAFAAEALVLPAESLLADEMDKVDPAAIHAVRQAARRALGLHCRAEFAGLYERFGAADAADVSGPAMAARALKNTALSYLTAAGEAHASTQFATARNMTDKLAALTNLAETRTPERDAALASFYEQWRHNPLVLDKWFAVQARGSADDTLARVSRLTSHADFDLRNPNRVRALIGAFATNPAMFHEPSGAGYTLLADIILRLDETNPQVAARLVTTLGSWRRFTPALQALMRAQLERILAKPNLSRNSYEMASKSLV